MIEEKCTKWFNEGRISIEQFNAVELIADVTLYDELKIMSTHGGNIVQFKYIIDRVIIAVTTHRVIAQIDAYTYAVDLSDFNACELLIKKVFNRANEDICTQTSKHLFRLFRCDIERGTDYCTLTITRKAARIIVRVKADFTDVEYYARDGKCLGKCRHLLTCNYWDIEGAIDLYIEMAKKKQVKTYCRENKSL